MKLKSILLSILPLFFLFSCGDDDFARWKKGSLYVDGEVKTYYNTFTVPIEINFDMIENLNYRDELLDIILTHCELGIHNLDRYSTVSLSVHLVNGDYSYETDWISPDKGGNVYINSGDPDFRYFTSDLMRVFHRNGYAQFVVSGRIQSNRDQVLGISFLQEYDLLVE